MKQPTPSVLDGVPRDICHVFVDFSLSPPVGESGAINSNSTATVDAERQNHPERALARLDPELDHATAQFAIY
jgi:hypothetical protein